MNKIGIRLFLAFGAIIVVLLIEIILNDSITRKASETYNSLKLEVGPAIRLLGDFRSANKELSLLAINKLNKNASIDLVNRLKEITEVEFPYFKSEVFLFTSKLQTNDPLSLSSHQLIDLANESMILVSTLNNLLITGNDYNNPKQYDLAVKLVEEELLPLNFTLDNNINSLQLKYNDAYEIYQGNLSESLDSISLIILIAGIFGIVLGLLVALTTIRSIVWPLKLLESNALRISRGDYEARVKIKGNDELSKLGDSFNTMADSLQKSFTEVNNVNKELSQFVYIASHDLQEPLRTVSSFTELMQDQYKDQFDERGHQYLQFITQGISRMNHLIKDLLDYGRIGRIKTIVEIDCNTLANAVIADLNNSISESGAKITIAPLPVIQGYGTELRLLFQNIISNSIKFRQRHTPLEIEITVEEDEHCYTFCFKDNGIGIAPEFKERIFAIFQRLHTKDQYEGTGIGLAHCLKVVKMHEGTMWVESALNAGSTFYFTLSKKISPI